MHLKWRTIELFVLKIGDDTLMEFWHNDANKHKGIQIVWPKGRMQWQQMCRLLQKYNVANTSVPFWVEQAVVALTNVNSFLLSILFLNLKNQYVTTGTGNLNVVASHSDSNLSQVFE